MEGLPKKEKIRDSEFVTNEQMGVLVSEGHEYANTPRMRELFRRARSIREGLPTLSDDHVRLWRGNRVGEIGHNPSFTNSLEGIALPFLDVYGGTLSYVDVLKTDLDKYLTNSGSAADSEFILTPELASKAIAIEDTSNS